MKHRTMLFRCGAVERLSYPEPCDAADDGDPGFLAEAARELHRRVREGRTIPPRY